MIIHCLGGGLVGSFVVRKLISAGYDVHLFDIANIEIEGATMHVGDALTADHAIINQEDQSRSNDGVALILEDRASH